VQQELFAAMDKNNQSQNIGGSNGDDFPF